MTPSTGLLATAIVAMAVVGCPRAYDCHATHPDEPKTGTEGASICAFAGERMRALNCRTARSDYAAWCMYELDHGVPLRPMCVAAAASCNAAEECR